MTGTIPSVERAWSISDSGLPLLPSFFALILGANIRVGQLHD